MNKGALDFTGLNDLASILGKRPGEMLGCIHQAEESGGCGTSESCTYCGAVNVVLKSKKVGPSVTDCRLTCGPEHKSFDLRIWASPLEFEGLKFTAITIQDIKDEKRREVYERLFFHDILNTLNGLTASLQLLKDFPDEIDMQQYLEKIDYFANNIFDEVEFHRMLTAAEEKTLNLNIKEYNSEQFLKEMVNGYVNQPIASSKTILIDNKSDIVCFRTDKTVLRRIFRNMINNALEATKERGKVFIGCKKIGETKITFWVRNEGEMPLETQLQIFQRSFSTKGKNRGLGTYSMKLLSSFLDGDIEFNTSQEKGTEFFAIFPINPLK
ncbi:MAG: HAMP domain-containing histidine kinase [Candidatus Lokiarchaeota archaeon]|nr:HAMP domain-containing histidine kinase [Candidatus Lokiarchaeota archaeon]